MYKMVSEFGNELKTVYSAIERNALISVGWHEELPEVIKETQPNSQNEPKEVKASGKTNGTGKNIR